jgi:hypothetical protein
MHNDSISPIDALMDEENTSHIVLYNEADDPVEFEQIAVIELRGKVYPLLRPLVDIPEIAEDEALVFAIEEYEGEQTLVVVQDDCIVDEVFEEYYRLLRVHGIEIE